MTLWMNVTFVFAVGERSGAWYIGEGEESFARLKC